MLKYLLILLFIGISFVNAENIQTLEKLKTTKQALELKLEAYILQKKIIEVESFLEQKRIEKENRVEREAALIKLKADLKRNRERQIFARAR